MISIDLIVLTVMVLIVNALFVPPIFIHAWRMINWESTSGTISEVRHEHAGDSMMTTPRISYDFSGKSFSIFSTSLTEQNEFAINEEIAIRVNQNNPEQYIIESWSVVNTSALMFLILDFAVIMKFF